MPGGSGFLGRLLTDRLVSRGDEVTVLTRGRARSGPRQQWIHWDGATLGPWTETLEGADAIVHLSGKRVDCRPTRANVRELIASRVDSVLVVGEAWRRAEKPPPVWVQLSSLAIFGEGAESVIDEGTEPSGVGPRQMVEVCIKWEDAFNRASGDVPRRVLLRAGIGFGGSGDPATQRVLGLARAGLGGTVGSGKQWVSWVSIDDFMTVLLRAIDDDLMSGLYHLTSPNPVRNDEMMATFRRLAGRRIGLPSPRLLTVVGAWLLGSDPALVLTGRQAVPTRLLAEGYRFLTPSFEEAARRAVEALN